MTATAELTNGAPAPSEAPASLRAVHTPKLSGALAPAGRLIDDYGRQGHALRPRVQYGPQVDPVRRFASRMHVRLGR